MNVKQLKDLLNNYSDDLEIRVWDLDTIFKPDDDLFLMSGTVANSQLLLAVNNQYEHENFQFLTDEVDKCHNFESINLLETEQGIEKWKNSVKGLE